MASVPRPPSAQLARYSSGSAIGRALPSRTPSRGIKRVQSGKHLASLKI